MPDPTNPTLHSDLATARYQRVESLFFAASDLPPADRQAFLNAQCGADTTLLLELESLLESDSSVSGLMATTPPPAEEDPWLNRTLGGYQIVELLGRGGMGVVYLGTRTAQGLSQKVAIKLIARHLQSTPAQTQFLLERDTLADLHHPNIARLLDGGLTPEGLPFVVMDYIEGQRLDTLADDPRTTLPQIASLIIQLCHAVGYTHRNLILHRDLKPGNVLVTPGGPRDEGVVKLLDFGTLKSLDPSLRRDSAMTEAGMRSLTLRYASPEHIRGDPPSTSMDVYSLGMTLYRLLAGRLPEADTDLTLPEQLHRLETRTPLVPSASMRTARRRLDPALTADLDAIALHAIRFDPAHRYPSADALAEDLQRALDRQPVLARAGTVRYRAARFFARNRTLVLGAAAALLVLAIGLPVMAHEASVANAQTARAQAGVEDERKLAHTLLFDYFTKLRKIPGSTPAQKAASKVSVAYLDQLSTLTNSPAIQLDNVLAYRAMGLLLGSPYEANLGDPQGALRALAKADAISQKLVSSSPDNMSYVAARIGVRSAYSQVYLGIGQPTTALRYLLAAQKDADRIVADPTSDSRKVINANTIYKGLADTYGTHSDNNTRNPEAAIAALRMSGRLSERAHQLDPTCCVQGIIIASSEIGEALEPIDADQAAQSYIDGFHAIAALSPADQRTSAYVRLDAQLTTRLGRLYLLQGRIPQGEAIMLPEREEQIKAILADPIDSRAREDLIDDDEGIMEGYRANALWTKLRPVQQEYLDNVNALLLRNPSNPSYIDDQIVISLQLANTLRHLHQNAAAQPLIDANLPRILKEADQPDADPSTLDIADQALLDLGTSKVPDAERAALYAQRSIHLTGPDPDKLITLAQAQRAAGHPDQSHATAESALKLAQTHPHSLRYKLQLKSLDPLLH